MTSSLAATIETLTSSKRQRVVQRFEHICRRCVLVGDVSLISDRDMNEGIWRLKQLIETRAGYQAHRASRVVLCVSA